MGATITTSTPKPLYEQNSGNMAVRRDLEELAKEGRTSEPCELNLALRERYDKYKENQYSDFVEKINTGRTIANLTEGKLVPLRHARTRQMLLVKRDGRYSDNKTVGGKFQFYMTNLMAEWMASRPERDPVCPSEQDQIEEFIKDVKIVQDYYDQKFFNTSYEKKEFLSAASFGTWITRYRFDPHTQDIICELLPFPACRWDTRVIPEESSYFIYESKCSTAELAHLLDADVNPDEEGEYDYGLTLIDQISRQGTGVRGQGKDQLWSGTDSSLEETIVTEMWLRPEAYCDIELAMPEKTVSGETLSKGRSLLKAFPDGMCVVGINNMQTIIGLYAENLKDHIVSGIYHDRLFSGVGKGVDDAVDVMKELNDLHSQVLAYVKAHSTPAYGYNKDMVSESDARDIGKPRKNIPFDFTNAPDGVRSVNDAIQAIVPSNPAQGAFEYREKLEDSLQESFQVTAFSQALPGVNNETATGAKIGESLAMKQLLPQHLNKADHRMRSDKVIYNLFKKFVNKPKWFSTRDKNGITAGKYLSGEQFDDVPIEFHIVANSETPKTQFADEQSLSRLFQFSGGAQGLWELGQQDPDYASEIVDIFGVRRLPIAKTTDIARVCRKRIEQAKTMLAEEMQIQRVMTAVTGQPVDNTDLSAAIVSRLMPPISPKELYVQQKIAWLSELLDADEMQYAEPELRYVIEEMIDTHVQLSTLGQAQMAQDANMATVMANLPSLVGQQIMDRGNQQLAQQYAEEQRQAQLVQQQQQSEQEANQQMQSKLADAELAERKAQADHQRALQLAA